MRSSTRWATLDGRPSHVGVAMTKGCPDGACAKRGGSLPAADAG